MFAHTYLLALLAASAAAGPVARASTKDPLVLPAVFKPANLCKLAIFSAFCPPASKLTVSVSTPLGTAAGVSTPLGAAAGVPDGTAARFSVKYGSASRWKSSSVATTWALPNGNTNASATPLVCPQSGVDASAYSEDCLSMILYVPASAVSAKSKLPIMMWIHGGSFIAGSATGPGLDGSTLATATGAIVAVVQYRLGALGFMAPDGSTNLGLGDIVTALNFLHTVAPSFGGDASQITLAGQSSGANMIRAMLAVPSASGLFKQAIIQSDPMDYGFLAPSTQSAMQSYFNGLLSCSSTDTACLNGLSVSSVLDAQSDLFSNAVNIGDGSAGSAEPIRVVRDGSLVTSPLDSTAAFPAQQKTVLLSTVLNEAAFTIYGIFSDPLAESAFQPVVAGTFDATRTSEIVNSSHYAPANAQAAATMDARTQVEALGTDYIWKCAAWTFARSWVQAGGKAYVGLYTLGATYPGNEDVAFCAQAGAVCHQDDIEIVFGTVPSPSAAQSALVKEMQARYKAFLAGGAPNAQGFESWAAAGTSDVQAKNLGSTGLAAVGSCDPSYWGQAVQYDYQVFGI